MTPGQKHWVENWEKERAQGKKRYVLTNAVGHGFFMWFFMSLFMSLINHGLTLAMLREAFFTSKSLIWLIWWLFGGLGLSLMLWAINERYHRKYTRYEKETPH